MRPHAESAGLLVMVHESIFTRGLTLLWVGVTACTLNGTPIGAAQLTGTFTRIAPNSIVDLTEDGPADWVHWGLYTEATLNRKAGVMPLISDFEPSGNGLGPYRFFDNTNGYSWSDGMTTLMVTNTITGVYKFGNNNGNDGFVLTVPAGTETDTLKLFVGTFAATGKLTATLSDGSAPAYVDSSLENAGNGPSGVYELQFAAGSPGQTLNITWFLDRRTANDGNVTLQAAALVLGNTNNPPAVTLVQPALNSKYAAGGDLPLQALTSDTDGVVEQVDFYAGTNLVAGTTSAPWTSVWSNAPAGHFVLTARATDNEGGQMVSAPIEVFGHNSGGYLSGTSSLPAFNVDLSLEGVADWGHWGLLTATSFNHKADVQMQITNFLPLGSGPVRKLNNYLTLFSWSDGTPTAMDFGNATAVYQTGAFSGFELTVPADTMGRRLHLYVGLYGARGNLQAYLSDFSAPAYTDRALQADYVDDYAVHMIDYRAASPGQSLIIRWKSDEISDSDFGNVTLAAATLVNYPVVVMEDVSGTPGTFSFNFPTEVGWDYTVESSDLLPPAIWQVVTNIAGDGFTFEFNGALTGEGRRYYRVRVN